MRQLSAVLSVGACLLLIAVLSATTPDPETQLRSYIDTSVGSWASTREFDVQVTEVASGRVVQSTSDYRDPFHSDATFVVTTVVVRSEAKSNLIFGELELHTVGDRIYHPREEFLNEKLPTTPPGFTATGQLVFEVPDDRLAGARLVIGPRSNAFEWYDVAARVDLGLDRPTKISSTPIKLSEPILAVAR